MLPRLETQPSSREKVDTLLLQHSVYCPDRAKILRSVVSWACSFQSLPKAEAPILELDLSWAVGVGAESEFNFSAAAALGFVPKQQEDLKITFRTSKFHVIDMEKGRVSHVVCQRFPHGEIKVVERRTVGIAFVVLQRRRHYHASPWRHLLHKNCGARFERTDRCCTFQSLGVTRLGSARNPLTHSKTFSYRHTSNRAAL